MSMTLGGQGAQSVLSILQRDVEDALVCTGTQVYISLEGETIAHTAFGVDGLERPMTTDTLHAVYCSTKPVTSVGIGILVDEGELSFHDRLEHVIEGELSPEVGALTIADVMTHRAGLFRLRGEQAIPMTDEQRDEAARMHRPPSGWAASNRSGYSEFVGWHLLGLSIEALTGESVVEWLHSRVIEPLGLDDDLFLGMTDARYDEIVDRIGVNVWMVDMVPMPSLLERARRSCVHPTPAFGGYATASALGQFYERTLDVLDGNTVAGLPSPETLDAMTSPQGEPREDPVLGRTVTFGYGFMTNLADHAYGRMPGDGSYGHSGLAGSSFAFCDPEHGLVVAVIQNGIASAESVVNVRRPVMVDGIYRDLGLPAPTADPAP